MRLALSGLLVLGLATLAGAQATAPALTIERQRVETANGASTLQGVKLTVSGVEIRADEATASGNGGELTLRGNVTVKLPKNFVMRTKLGAF